MKHTDQQLFGRYYNTYKTMLDSKAHTPREFMSVCSALLEKLANEPIKEENLSKQYDEKELRKYRKKAIKFYKIKSEN